MIQLIKKSFPVFNKIDLNRQTYVPEYHIKIWENSSNYNLISLVSVHIKFYYYLGIIPFKVYFDRNTEKWKIHSSKLQNIFCYVGVILSNVYSEITQIPLIYWYRFLAAPSLSAKTYFSCISQLLHSFGCLQFFWIFTTKRELILEFLNSMQQYIY